MAALGLGNLVVVGVPGNGTPKVCSGRFGRTLLAFPADMRGPHVL